MKISRSRSKVKVTVTTRSKSHKSIFLGQFKSNHDQTLGQDAAQWDTKSIKFWERSDQSFRIQIQKVGDLENDLHHKVKLPYRVIHHFEANKNPYLNLLLFFQNDVIWRHNDVISDFRGFRNLSKLQWFRANIIFILRLKGHLKNISEILPLRSRSRSLQTLLKFY